MKPSRLRRATVLALAVGSTMSACSAFRPPNEVLVQKVPVDLTFGAEITETAQGPQLQPNLPRASVLELPDFPKRPKPTLPPVELCPRPKGGIPAAPKFAAEASITNEDFPVVEEKTSEYLMQYHGNVKGKEPQSVVGVRKIEVTSQNRTVNGKSIAWSDSMTKRLLWFATVPDSEGETLAGLYLKQIHWPTSLGKKGRVIEFIPNVPRGEDPDSATDLGLKLLAFPIQSGTSLTETASDSGLKDELPDAPAPIDNDEDPGIERTLPSGETVRLTHRSSGNTLTSTVEVGDRDIIDVCDEAVQAWRVNWTLESSAPWEWTMIGTFWIATTGFAGMPVKDDYLIFGDGKLIEGNFSSNLMKIDPGNYL